MPGELEGLSPNTPPPTSEKKGFWSRFRRNRSAEPKPEKSVPAPRESIESILEKTELPEREVSLDDISLYKLPVNWGGLMELGLSINKLKGSPVQRVELQALKPPPELNNAIPMVASVIAHHYNPEIPIILPNKEEIEQMKPWLRKVSQFLGRFSEKLQYKFGRYIEGVAEQQIGFHTRNILEKVETLGPIGEIRTRFTPELANIYKRVLEKKYRKVEDFFGLETYETEVPIEENIEDLLTRMKRVPYGHGGWLNDADFPLTSKLLKLSGSALGSINPWIFSIAGSEMTQGIRTYLAKEGVKSLPEAAEPVKTFDLLDPDTWDTLNIGRSFGESFMSGRLEAVKRELPDVLAKVKAVLPENGTEVANSVRILAENILILRKKGVASSEIASALFLKPESKRGD